LVERKQDYRNLLELVSPVLKSSELEAKRELVDKVYVDKSLVGYIVSLIAATREHPGTLLGASPRASLALTSMSKAMAYLQGRDYVTPDDIPPVFNDTLSHRLILRPGAAGAGVAGGQTTVLSILNDVLKSVAAPRVG